MTHFLFFLRELCHAPLVGDRDGGREAQTINNPFPPKLSTLESELTGASRGFWPSTLQLGNRKPNQQKHI